MNINSNHTFPASSVPLPTSNASSITFHNFLPTLQNQQSTVLDIPLSSPQLHFPVLPFQQPFEFSHLNETQSQTLSLDEWSLIMSLRLMKNISVSPSLTQTPFYQNVDSATSHQAISSYQASQHLQASECYATTPSYCYFPYTAPPPVSQRVLNAQENQSSPIQTQASVKIPIPSSTLLTTVARDSPTCTIVGSSSPPSTIAGPSSSPSFTRTASQSSAIFTTTASLSPHSITAPHLSLPLPTISTREEPTPTFKLPQAQSSHENHSYAQQQQKSPTQNILASGQHSSINSQSSATHEYDPLIVGPTVQLIDPKKPYKIGDAIKVGGRTLQSDICSMKYWIEDDATITETATGGHVLNMAGFSYFAKNYGKNFTTWECEHRRHHRCSSVVIRSSDPKVKNYFRIYSIQGEHIHESTPENVEIRRLKQRVRDRCRQELSSPRLIYEDELMKGKYSAEMKALLPTFYNMQAHLYRIRQAHLPISPTDPKFVLHAGFTTTDRGDRFLLYDSNSVQVPYARASPQVGRLLIYTSDLQLEILSKSKRIGSDGTFETAAQISHQNYIIMGEIDDTHNVPLVFCLCEHKNYETYKLIIQVLKTAVINLKLDFVPVYWMSDYEGALTKAIKEELPNTILLGCAFHFSQAIYRNIQGKGLQDAYQNVEAVRQILRQVMALAFIPNDQIITVYYDVIKPQINKVPRKPASLRHNLHDFFKYFESFWLKKINQFCVFDQSTRTNNSLEGYNNKMRAQIAAHPHLYRLIVWFEKEELLVQQLVMKLRSDAPIHKRKQNAITILTNDSLQCLWSNYNAGKLDAKDLLIESSKWVAKKAS